MKDYKATIYIKRKEGVLDPEGYTIKEAVTNIGHYYIKDIKVGKFYNIVISADSLADAEQKLTWVSEQILSNPIIEQFKVEVVED
ncbi:phosphoribosylformylglycinamidine synthase subunit PurS [bacterium]|nr:phosphoribosylformylglycinamidine synthase subunit PurS [bacterium]